MVTWWEAEEMAAYISQTEVALDEWSMSDPQMRIQQNNIDRLEKQLKHSLAEATDQEKKEFIAHLVSRIEDLRMHLTERLKRDIPGYRPSLR
jgi:50S ribosomal subunit-associated GTPase HflX